jgi:hypothetical protein
MRAKEDLTQSRTDQMPNEFSHEPRLSADSAALLESAGLFPFEGIWYLAVSTTPLVFAV